jgi:two-component system C4-dicarboxylate transport response regulator DctD
MFSAHADISIAIQAIRIGAYDFLEKTEEPENHLITVQRAWKKRELVLENRNLRNSLQDQHKLEHKLVGQTAIMQRLRESVMQLAQVDVDLIINGETGTGKEVVAQCLHQFGPRANKPFVALNCGALSESIIESELFGHEAGAFTGALKKRIGKIEYAQGGTLFLDEIESMPATLQVRLLRVLQERTLQRLGGNTDISVDIRVIGASKSNLLTLAEQGEFREDLYYRLNVAHINLVNLANRKEDIALLFSHFTQLADQRLQRKTAPLSRELVNQLQQKSWPGNVRELRNMAERWVLGLALDIEQLHPQSSLASTGEELPGTSVSHSALAEESASLDQQMDLHEKLIISAALKRNKGQIEQTAINLGIPRKKLYLRMKKYSLDRQNFA